ncbi:MAG: oxidoreductase [Myxococcota bacterium]
MSWSVSDIPDQTGRNIVITGANSGLGLESVFALAQHNARVIMACRNPQKADAARQQALSRVPGADLRVEIVDLGDLASVRAFAERLDVDHIDILLNNAGVMAIPRSTTKDGFETQIGVNHLGHFALTGGLMDRLLAAPSARIVTVSSLYHRPGRIRFDDLHGVKTYAKWEAYAQSKLANVLFTLGLHERLSETPIIACGAHPGYASTNLQMVGPQQENALLMERVMGVANAVFAQSAAKGALPQLYAATAPDVQGNDYFGPSGLFEMWGSPKKAAISTRGQDVDLADRLWQRSVEETGVDYSALT